MKKKIFSFVIALCLIIPTMFGLISCDCGSKEPENTMKLSINPGVTFVLDANDNIMNVTYINEDAGTIYANIDFTGMDLETAIDTFVEYATISGYVDLNGEEVKIEVNGKVEANITELEEKAKSQVEAVFDRMNINVTVDVNELTEAGRKTALINTAKALAPELLEDDLENMTNEELINLINEKQEEYKGLAYSQISSIISSVDDLIETNLAMINTTYNNLLTQIEGYEEQLSALDSNNPLYQSINSQLQLAKNTLQQTKAQMETIIENILTQKETLIEQAKAQYDEVKATYKTEFENLVKSASADVTAHLESAKNSGKITEAEYTHMIELINANKAN